MLTENVSIQMWILSQTSTEIGSLGTPTHITENLLLPNIYFCLHCENLLLPSICGKLEAPFWELGKHQSNLNENIRILIHLPSNKMEIGHIPGTVSAEISYPVPYKLKCGRDFLLGIEAPDLVRR